MKNLILRHILFAASTFCTMSLALAQYPVSVTPNYGPRKMSPGQTTYIVQNAKDAKTGHFVDQSTPMPAIVQVVRDSNKKSGAGPEAGVFFAGKTIVPQNALEIIREELTRLQMRDSARADQRNFMSQALIRLTPETLTFFVAGGLVTFNSMWIKSHGDPLAMQRQIESLKDPIAHFSFLAFMAANGFYMKQATKGMDQLTKMQSMKLLSYKGMAVGSLASSIVADVGHTFQTCVNDWLKGKNDKKSQATCSDALNDWSVRGKVTTYFPMVVSMWVTQAASEVLDAAGKKAFQKIEATTLAQKILNKEWLVKNAYKITGADLVVSLNGGTWVMKGVKFVGHLTQISAFLAADHFLSTYVYRGVNNIIKPALFDFDARAINGYLQAYENGNWDDSKIVMPGPYCKGMFGCVASLEAEIDNYTVQTQQWREHLNADAEADLAGWTEMTKKLLNQVDYAYQYYSAFVKSVRETMGLQEEVRKGAPVANLNDKGLYPDRTLPLFGVSMGQITIGGGSAEDLYLTRPWEIQKRQLENIESTMKDVTTWEVPLGTTALAKYKKIIAKLNSKDIKFIASGLNDMNQLMGITPAESEENQISTYPFTNLYFMLYKIRQLLGAPLPVMYPVAGFSQAFLVNNAYSAIGKSADFSLWSVTKKYKFNKETDLMLYKMICGKATASLDTKRIFGNDMLMPQFDPPSLLNAEVNRDEFCNSYRSTGNLYSTKIDGKNLSDFLKENLSVTAIGDYTKKKETESTFDGWWMTNSKDVISKEFKNYDVKYKELVNTALANIFGTDSAMAQRTTLSFAGSLAKRALDNLNQSKYLQKSLMAQFKADTEFYLQITERALTDGYFKTIKKDSFNFANYLEQTVLNSQSQDKFEGYAGVTHPSVAKTSVLMKQFMNILYQKDVDFEGYIKLSKEIDTAINDMLVDANLKTCTSLLTEKPAVTAKNLTSSKAKEVAKETKKPLCDINDPFCDSTGKTPSVTGSESSDKTYEDVKLMGHTARQRAIIAATRGLRQVESEIRRFIRMKIMMSQTLEIDQKEFMNDWNNVKKSELDKTRVRGANPRGV